MGIWTRNPLRLAARYPRLQLEEPRDVAVPVTASKRRTELPRKDESRQKRHLIRPETSPVINLTPVNMRCFIRHFAELHAVQIQTVRFWQHLQAAVAPAPLQQVQSDPVKPWRSTKSPVWCPYSPSVSTSWLRRQPPIPATSLPPASPSPTPAAVAVTKAEVEGEKEKKSESSEDSDSESDTSSDSGHSSDDHEAAKEEEQASAAAAVASNTMASEAPPCVEVASL